MTRQESRTALITGASSGIGRAYAIELARRGYSSVLVARRADRLKELCAQINSQFNVSCSAYTADLSDLTQVMALAEKVTHFEPISMLVHSAGFNAPYDYSEWPINRIAEMIVLHDMAGAVLSRAVLDNMRRTQSGTIIFVSSLASFYSSKGYVPYSATKAFLNMLAIGLASELGRANIIVQAVAAGLVRTEFLESSDYLGRNPYANAPSWAFQTPEEVVKGSLAALDKRSVIFVPGRLNRLLVRILNFPILGRITVWMMNRASRTA